MEFEEIENIRDIAAAHKQLSSVLKRRLRHCEHRVVGYPSGYFEDAVFFKSAKGERAFWWNGGESTSGRELLNFFGHGEPGTSATLLIDLQFNFPKGAYDRRHGGVFLRHIRSGRIALAHRGIVTRGKSRVRREWLLEEANLDVEEVASSAQGGRSEVLPVGFVDDADIDARIEQFCIEVRRAATVVMDNEHSAGDSKPLRGKLADSLSAYFDEFIGSVRYARSSDRTSARFTHGAVVRSLKENFGIGYECKKSSKIDLVAVRSPRCFVCEVKTDTSWQSLYTAIGQLFVHAATVQTLYPRMKIEKVLVAPIGPSPAWRRRLLSDLGCHVVTFHEDSGRYTMTGLDAIKES